MVKIDRLFRSRRKTLALYVRPDGSLEVRAPSQLSLAAIQAFVESKADWIVRRRTRIDTQPAVQPRIGYTSGSRVWLLGQALTIQYSSADNPRIRTDGSHLLIPSAIQSLVETAILAWYKAQARKVITDRVEHFDSQFNLSSNGVRISSARSRWGSCGAGNRLNFPYRLVMAPIDVIDYVVVHELVHTVVRNHGPAFWARVAAILPDYCLRRKWLQLNGRLLDLACEADPQQVVPVIPGKSSRLKK